MYARRYDMSELPIADIPGAFWRPPVVPEPGVPVELPESVPLPLDIDLPDVGPPDSDEVPVPVCPGYRGPGAVPAELPGPVPEETELPGLVTVPGPIAPLLPVAPDAELPDPVVPP